MQTTQLKVTGMTCQNCVQHVRQALQQVPGVQQASVDLDRQCAEIVHQNVAVEQLVAAVREEGYDAAPAGL